MRTTLVSRETLTTIQKHPACSAINHKDCMQNRRDGLQPKSVIRLLRANEAFFCHLFQRFSVTMEPHCAFKAPKHLFKNKDYYHRNANDRFGFNSHLSAVVSEEPYHNKRQGFNLRKHHPLFSSLFNLSLGDDDIGILNIVVVLVVFTLTCHFSALKLLFFQQHLHYLALQP